VEEAAVRELREETGYTVAKVSDMTPLLVADPGQDTQPNKSEKHIDTCQA
jgi:8-oxo-dGTP pyrophosphatase MutT (NUDIX family)